jgi:hypothetical protein
MNNNGYLSIEFVLICMLFDICCRHVLECQGSITRPNCEENGYIVEVAER